MKSFTSGQTNYHKVRKKEISEKFPEVRELMGHHPISFLWIIGLVGLQWGIGIALSEMHFIWIALVAYGFGAFVNHALYVLVHECTHNLVFRKSVSNKLAGLVCDVALVLPSAMAFRKYHMLHHRHLGDYHLDPDVTPEWEGKLIGNRSWAKVFWLSFFSLSQALRPYKVKSVEFWDGWIITNLLSQFLIIGLSLVFLPWQVLTYLLLSTFFALGLHPVGGRWIQEHFVFQEGQETYSYYGPLNKTCFNMGYHNEHHDFMNIPWNNLPKLKKLAPDYYEGLHYHTSWIKVLKDFFFDKKMTPFTRIVKNQ